MSHQCIMEFPPTFTDQLKASINVDLLEQPSYEPAAVIKKGQKYIVRVSMEMAAAIKKLICADWCVCVAAESIGAGTEGQVCETLSMDNCNPAADTVEIAITGDWLAGDNPAKCGQVSYLVVTVVALDKCEGEPLGIAGFCKVGPVMVYSG